MSTRPDASTPRTRKLVWSALLPLVLMVFGLLVTVGILRYPDQATRLWHRITSKLGPGPLPVDELKGIVELHRKENNSVNLMYKDYSYDVRKTDSLVSPYAGVVTYSDAGPPMNGPDYEVTFAYQDRRWVAKDFRCGRKAEQKWFSGDEVRRLTGHDELTKGWFRGWNWAIKEYYR